MKRLLCLLLVCLLLPLAVSAHADTVNDTVVRVLLSTDGASSVTVTLAGAYAVNGTSVNGGTVTATMDSGTIRVQHSSAGALGESAKSVRLERKGTDEGTLLTFQNAKHGVKSYSGDFVFYNDGGTLRVVNYVDLKHYLYGVVSGEMSDSSRADLLKVAAIAAKGFVLSEVAARTSRYFDVYDTTTSQLYYGYAASDTNTIAAVDAVWTQTLLYAGNVVKTYYSTANGGQMLTPYIRWGGRTNEGAYSFGYDPFDLAGSSRNVILTVNGAAPQSMPAALSAFLLDKAGSGAKEIVSVDALEGVYDTANPNGTDRYPKSLAPQTRYDWTLTVQTDSGAKKQVSFSCTPDEVKTAAASGAAGTVCFAVHTAKSEWKLVWGVSSGHRTGLSHRGAGQMVKQGYSYVDVLKFYYRGAVLYDANGRAIESAAVFAFTYEEGAGSTVSPSPSPTPGPAHIRDVIVTSNTLNLRQGPSTATTSLKQLKLGAVLGVYGSEGEWLYVQDTASGLFGYVHGSYVSEYQTAPEARWEGVCNADDSNLRAGPSTNFAKYWAINKGDPLYVYYLSGNWYFVMDRNTGQGAFIYKSYVTLGQAAPRAPVGDVNGDGAVDASDAALIMRHLVRLSKIRDSALLAADMAADGTVGASDAAMILRFVTESDG